VLLNDRSMKIVARARDLASDGRDERTAVGELLALTGRHHHDLRVAVAELRRRAGNGDRTDLRARLWRRRRSPVGPSRTRLMTRRPGYRNWRAGNDSIQRPGSPS
jgi:hypothetical protein